MMRKMSLKRKLVLAVEYIWWKLTHLNISEDSDEWFDNPICYFASNLKELFIKY